MLKRLRIKFICINMAIVTIMLTTMFGSLIHFTRITLERQSIQLMEQVLNEPILPGRPGDPSLLIPPPHFVLTQDEQGEIAVLYNSYYDLSDGAFLTDLFAAVSQQQEKTGVIARYDLRFCRASTPQGELVAFADISAENNIITGLLRNCSYVAAGSFLVFLFISILLARWSVRPVELAWQRQRQFVADAVRSMNHSYGLGLSIARRIVSDHNGRIWCESEGGVNSFFVQLPTV